MSTTIIANPSARGGKAGKLLKRLVPEIAAHFGTCDLIVCDRPGGIREQVRLAVTTKKSDPIVLVGGDGTFHEGVNGLKDPKTGLVRPNAPALLLIPLGTGGDLSRTIDIRARQITGDLAHYTPQPIDLGKIECSDHQGHPRTELFINLTSCGVSAAIAEKVNQSSKKLGGRLSFFFATLAGLVQWRDRRVRLTIDNQPPKELAIQTIAIANGRFFGGGMEIAPRAQLNDGLFDVITIQDVGITRFLGKFPKVYKGKHLGLDEIDCTTGKKVVIEPVQKASSGPMPIESDGEIVGRLPVTATILPKAVRIYLPNPP